MKVYQVRLIKAETPEIFATVEIEADTAEAAKFSATSIFYPHYTHIVVMPEPLILPFDIVIAPDA